MFQCREKNETGKKKPQGDSFLVEKFSFRWPEPACFSKGVNPYLCLHDKGHRKVVIDPRKVNFSPCFHPSAYLNLIEFINVFFLWGSFQVEYLCIHGPQAGDEYFPPLDHLHAGDAAHAHFKHLFGEGSGDLCNDTRRIGKKVDWWKEDDEWIDHVARLRKDHICDFRTKGVSFFSIIPSLLSDIYSFNFLPVVVFSVSSKSVFLGQSRISIEHWT